MLYSVSFANVALTPAGEDPRLLSARESIDAALSSFDAHWTRTMSMTTMEPSCIYSCDVGEGVHDVLISYEIEPEVVEAYNRLDSSYPLVEADKYPRDPIEGMLGGEEEEGKTIFTFESEMSPRHVGLAAAVGAGVAVLAGAGALALRHLRSES